jgi:hypothetical protein
MAESFNGRSPSYWNLGDLISNCFVVGRATKQFSSPTKPFSAFRAEFRKPAMVIKRPTNTGGQRRTGKSGEKSMRTLSFILALVFVVAGSSMAGSVESGLPGVGTFSYNGTPVAPSQSLVVAAR